MNLHESIKKYLNESSNQPAYVVCYGQLEIWPNVESAKRFYREGMDACEGAEQERYMNIVYSLGHGNFFADDFGPEDIRAIVDRDENGHIIRERVNAGKMTHEEAVDYILKLQNAGLHESDAPQNYERGNAPFESKRVPEDRIREEGYLYFSTHGTGPGTKPKDVRVKEMDWDLPSGWVAIKTDRPLTSEELSWYNIQPETKNSYYKQRFHLSEATINEREELDTNYYKHFDHVNDVWNYLESSTSEEDLKEKISEIDPYKFGSIYYDLHDDGNGATVIIDYQSDNEDYYEKVDVYFNENVNESEELPKLPENLIKYLDTHKGMDEFPTVEKDGTKWFSVSQAEYDSLKDYVDKVDSIPEDVWRTWDDKKKLDISNFANNAERVCKNCIIKETEEIEFKDDKEAKLYDDLHNNIYFEEKDVKRNGLGKLLIDLKDLSDDDFNKVAEFIKGKPEYILNKNNKKICIMGNRKDNKLDEAHVAPFNDRLDNTMLDAFANHYYKYQEQPHKWTKKEMRDWIIDNKKDNPNTKIDLVHLNNLLDFQHDLYDMDMEDLNESESPEELVVETCDMEQTGGWVWVGYGKLTNGKYYVLFSEGLNLYDADIHKYEYEEDHYDEVDGYYGDYEDAHRIASYDFTSPEYKSVLKQCVKLNEYAEYLLDDDEREEFAAEERRETLYKQIDDLYKESEGEDVYENPDYYVDTRDLTLTNGNYHNNADMIYGRIIVKGKTKNAKDVGAYDIMYIPENNHLSVFMPGFDVQGLSDIIYAFYEPNDWIKIGDTRMQYKDITEDFDNTFASDMVKIDPRTKEAITNTIDNAYYNEKPIPLNTRRYQ